MLKFIVVTFDYIGYEIFEKMTQALIYSIEKHEPGAKYVVRQLKEPEQRDRVRGLVNNTVKLNVWYEELQRCSDGDYVVFLDADTLLLNPIHDIFNQDFDIAYTERTRSKWVVNGGVLFVKVNEKSRKFFERYVSINNQMFNDQKFHDEYRQKYAGMNQSAFGYMLEHESYHCNLKALPCGTWNACGEDWPEINDKTRIVHINGQARKAIFGGTPQHETVKPYNIWTKYYAEFRDDERLTKELGDTDVDIERMAGK